MVHYLKKSLALIPILLLISSCDKGCVESYQFDTEVVTAESKPVADGIDGQYNNVTGGQSANWHETGLRVNGEPIVVSIGGAWTSWNTGWQGVKNEDGLAALRECQICFMKPGATNCMCAPGQFPQLYDVEHKPISGSTCNSTDQDDPNACTCTSQQGTINDDGVYGFAVDYQSKTLAALTPDQQKECKFNKGLGLYAALFGTDGQTTPKRAYHLYSYTSICDLNKTPCVDADGKDATRYLYTSPNNKIFVKDDNATPDPNDDVYHRAGEILKVRISDRYYSDNYGAYDLIFMGGVMRNEDRGLLEYIVGTFEDVLLGKRADPCIGNCSRSGGVVEYMYNSIVKDSTFIFIVQLLLILYVTLFGLFNLAGVVDISRKELMKRVLKIGLIIFFTSATSWAFYNQFVVGLFKNSMDYILSIFMGFADQVFFTSNTGEAIQTNSMVSIAQAERAVSTSNATRFSYVDLTIKMLFSDAIAKKVWSLFFGTWFGILYIPAIYGLIFFFTYTMLTAALVYIVSMIKLLFVIALGPLFIIASLFSQMEGIFKRWISFMAARAFEIIMLFVVLYTFLVLINNDFKSLFSYRACVEPYNVGLFSLNIVKVYTSRSFIGWVSILLKIGAMILMLRFIMEKIPGLAGSMVQISGTAGLSGGAAETNKSAFGIAKDVMGKVFEAGKFGVTRTLPSVAEQTHSAVGFAFDKAGISDKWNNFKDKIPVRNPMSIARDMTIDGAIKTATAAAKAKGLTGAALDKEIRQQTFNALFKSTNKKDNPRLYSESDSAGMSILGINAESIGKRLDDKLVKDPLKKIIKEEAAKLKNQDGRLVPVGEEMRAALREKVMERAQKEMFTDPKTLEKYMANFSDLMREQGELSSSEAARKFAGRPELQSKFMEHLKAKQFQEKLDSEKAERQGGLLLFGDKLKKGFKDKLNLSTKNVEENFVRRSKYEEDRRGTGLISTVANKGKGFGIVSRINFLDKYLDTKKMKAKEKDLEDRNWLDKRLAKKDAPNFGARGRDAEISTYEDYILNGYKADMDRIKSHYDEEMGKFRSNTGILSKSEIEKNREEAEELARKKLREYSEKLGVGLREEKQERPGDQDVAMREDGAALPAVPAAPVVPDDKMAKVQESLDKITTEPAADKTKEQKDQEALDSIEQLKRNLKEHYAEQKQGLESKLSELRAKHADLQREINAIKAHVVRTPADEARLQQLEYDEQRCAVQLTVTEGQKQRVSDSLTKVD